MEDRPTRVRLGRMTQGSGKAGLVLYLSPAQGLPALTISTCYFQYSLYAAATRARAARGRLEMLMEVQPRREEAAVQEAVRSP